ncbi:MAG TPA: hypothetical protein VGR73_17415 [Bryobacteraceae bacterium]|nr:hypothetical protein [Bryobacteraceae bacterium]
MRKSVRASTPNWRDRSTRDPYRCDRRVDRQILARVLEGLRAGARKITWDD